MIIQSITQITSIRRSRYLIILEIMLDNLLYYVRTKREIPQSFAIRSCSLTAHILLSNLFRILFRIESETSIEILNLKVDRYLIVANHQRALDPCLIFASLPLSSFRILLPIRFFTANIYLKTWWQRMFLGSFGCFRAYSTDGKISGVKGGLYFSDKGQSLFIFPEGKRNRNNSKIELKVGAGYLAQKRDFTILPVSINYSDKKTSVIWGEPFRVNDKSSDLEKLTKTIFKKVLQLSAQK